MRVARDYLIYKYFILAANQSSRLKSTLGNQLHKNPRRTKNLIRYTDEAYCLAQGAAHATTPAGVK